MAYRPKPSGFHLIQKRNFTITSLYLLEGDSEKLRVDGSAMEYNTHSALDIA